MRAYTHGASPDADLFASRLDIKMERFMSFRPESFAKIVDAFSVSWKDIHLYAFPPLSVIGQVLQKVQRESRANACWWSRVGRHNRGTR